MGTMIKKAKNSSLPSSYSSIAFFAFIAAFAFIAPTRDP